MSKKQIRGASVLCAVIAFAVFLVAACAAYYMTVGVFVTAEIAILYAVLGALGALALLLRFRLCAFFFYVGCVLGWLSGRFVGGLEGDFAPTAGLICTFSLIFVFSVLGVALEWKSWKHRLRKSQARQEKQQREDEERERVLMEEQAAKAATAGASAQPPKAEAPAADTPKDQTVSS